MKSSVFLLDFSAHLANEFIITDLFSTFWKKMFPLLSLKDQQIQDRDYILVHVISLFFL